MSYSIDSNVLLYGSDRSSPHYDAARDFLAARASDPDLLCLTWPTLMGYVRVSTHPRVFPAPLSPEEAWRNVDGLLAQPRVRIIQELDGFVNAYREVTSGFAVRGNLVSDAHVATILRQSGVRTIYTNDRDFLKFDFLTIRNPF